MRGERGRPYNLDHQTMFHCSCVFLLLFDVEQILVERLLSDMKQKRREVDSMTKELEEIQNSILQQLRLYKLLPVFSIDDL